MVGWVPTFFSIAAVTAIKKSLGSRLVLITCAMIVDKHDVDFKRSPQSHAKVVARNGKVFSLRTGRNTLRDFQIRYSVSTRVAVETQVENSKVRRTINCSPLKYKDLKLSTKSVQSSALETGSIQRAVLHTCVMHAMFSFSPICPKYKDNFCPAAEGEKDCNGVSGGGNAAGVEPSLPKLLVLHA